MKLYYTPGTCSLAAHILLRELGIEFDMDRVDHATKRTESGEDFLKINAKGYVAALRLDNGEVLTEGAAILLYLADVAGVEFSVPVSAIGAARLHEWLVYIAAELHPTFGPLFHSESDTVLERSKQRLYRKLDIVESGLSDGRRYLLGSSISIADIYLFVVVNWTGHLGIDLTPWPFTQALLQRVSERPAVKEAMTFEGLL
ncbi:glutathione transferase GstA [Stenotrophomonas sp. GD03993]|uniref:glutathione transferase GstA n=1 Tax=unclassified Stenotrophomonas TaxID=196198 RepID=UPI0024476EBE|nr:MULTISPECIES: glutathione transferase GstA [Stenotrophomonas]MDH0186930.1 glutathione transferase GstA [Stenotrophomonas sp. GD04051]MDH0464007.1 glutathione transferase GstA [Stenotrophomonas sp. GD03993]MDH0874629.1 glutathione transferase GstA [Stenotrophomonas sp. GD03877]MDH2155086.1 glutathione transferase GstA [Stenotrophomonas sp. GD03657]